MARPIVYAVAMTNAERQRRHRAKLAAIEREVDASTVLENLARDYQAAYATPKQRIRAGVAKLLRKWEREAERLWPRQRSRTRRALHQ
jgi:hypothetical protein